MKSLRCLECKKAVKLHEGGAIPADSQGGLVPEKALCGKCKPKVEMFKSGLVIKEGKGEKVDPRTKTVNKRARDKNPWATVQPYKKEGGRVVDNEDFYKYYGGEKAAEPSINPDPEKAMYYKKKYPKPSYK